MVLDFVPESGVPQAFFDGIGNRDFRTVDPEAIGNVVKNGLGEGVGTLKNHADAAAKGGYVLGQNILPVEENLAIETGVAHGLVHAVKGAKESGLAATGGANERGDLVGSNAHADIEEGLLAAVKE